MRTPVIIITAFLVSSAPAFADCKSDLIEILDAAPVQVPSQQDFTIELTKSSADMAKSMNDMFNDQTTIRFVPPDRKQTITARNNVPLSEFVSIGNRYWRRSGGSTWEIGLAPPDRAIPNAKEILRESIRAPKCLGTVMFEGRAAVQFRYEIVMPATPTATPSMESGVTLWIEPGTNRPIRMVQSLIGPEMETAITTKYTYDVSIKIEAPTDVK
jgi:hypothetical protein